MTRRIAWTGGFDSTYLVADALLAGDVVEAVTWRGYGMPADWQKVRREDEARRRIEAALPLEFRRHLITRTEESARVVEQFDGFREELERATAGKYSPQNAILAGLPLATGAIETAHVRDDATARDPSQLAIINRYGLSNPLAGVTKQMILDDAKRRGFAHLLEMTWTCDALDEESEIWPCGRCESCQHRILQAVAPC